jgi:L-alanine-DL-glutamate epimerase-like enolase superfamily enzyme
MTRRTFCALAGLAPFAATDASSSPTPAARNHPPQKITKIETFILRDPPVRDKPESDFVSMTPIGRMTNRTGLGYRLEHAETVRQGGYRQTLLVKVSTDQGLHGWGESHAVMTPRVVQTAITDLFTPILLGENALDVEVLWDKMYSTQRLRGYSTGFYKRAMAGIDIALWDILGKASGMPVYQLLGGKYRDTIPTYQGVGGSSIPQLVENAQGLIERGFTMMKMGLSKGRGDTSDVGRIAAVAELLKGKGEILVDSLGAYTLAEAVKTGREIDAIGNVGWWEDVLMPEDIDGLARLADALDVPICAGEQYSNRFQFRDIFHRRAADIINPDISRVGLTDYKRIAIMAEAHQVLHSPHSSMGSAPYRTSAIHVCAATSNSVILEGGESHLGAFGNQLLQEPLDYQGGFVRVPDRPGLGIEFNEAELKKLIVG